MMVTLHAFLLCCYTTDVALVDFNALESETMLLLMFWLLVQAQAHQTLQLIGTAVDLVAVECIHTRRLD